MKRIGIVSDTHGDCGHLEMALMKMEAEGRLDAVIHCGDGARDAQRVLQSIMQMPVVAGNCDGWATDLPEDLLISFHGVKVFITHGHRYMVKSGMDMLAETAAAKDAQIACFGHTHRAFQEYRNGVLLLNPGACVYTGSCMLLTIDARGNFSVKAL